MTSEPAVSFVAATESASVDASFGTSSSLAIAG